MSVSPHDIETSLVQELREKSEKAFKSLYQNYSSALYGVALRIVNSPDAAADVLQEGFIKIWKNIDQYDAAKGSLFTWMLNIVRNTAIDYTRSKHVKYSNQGDSSIVHTEMNKEQTNYDHIGIHQNLEKLKPEQRQVIDAVYIFGMTQQETAAKLDIPLGTVKTRIRTALKDLRRILKDRLSER